MAGSLFLLPASIAQVSQYNSYEGNSEMRMNVLGREEFIAGVLGAFLGGALGSKGIPLLVNLIYRKTEEISSDIIPLKNDLINKLQAESNILQSKLNELQGKIEKQIGNNQNFSKKSLEHEARKINNNIEDVKVDVERIVRRLNERS